MSAGEHGPAPAGGALRVVELPVPRPFDVVGVFDFLARRAVAGVEIAELPGSGPLRYARTLPLPGGPGAVDLVAVPTANRSAWRLTARLELASPADEPESLRRVRRLLDLDADPGPIDAALAADPVLAPLVARTPGIRVPGTVDPHEMVVRALVGQQITVAAARTHLGRLAAVAGARQASTIAGLERRFPTAAEVAALPVAAPGEALDPDRPLRLPRQSAAAIVSTARALADGELVISEDADPAALRAALVRRPRIGEWTAGYVAMRVLGDADAWLPGDVALVAGAKAVEALDPDEQRASAHRTLAARSARWAPWRSYAAMHLWQAAGAPPPRHR